MTSGKEIVQLGLPDQFIEHGTVKQLQEIAGIDANTITEIILS